MLSPYSMKPCRRCGVDFEPSGSNSRWCSDECRRGVKTCQECSASFVPSKNAAGLFCSRECWSDHAYPIGAKKLFNGYVIIKVPRGTPGTITQGSTLDRWMFEHRYVMQKKIQRPLLKSETVHHKNGDKTDNSEDNLELWIGRHGKGIRHADYHCPGCRCFD